MLDLCQIRQFGFRIIDLDAGYCVKTFVFVNLKWKYKEFMKVEYPQEKERLMYVIRACMENVKNLQIHF